eukprot:TRINITY_DN5202_c0_g1_i1.p1 TRINITY_DN5202_c0_g1~~TRINITY_DN5202_c0_g1_i1.p1  ORF type:complete len:370 (+),score=89.26 TRINITY_DN5202_c0_g1_i1:158-1111(+)
MEPGDLPQEYWQVQKLVKFIRTGNQNASVIALSSLLAFDLSSDLNVRALREVSGMEPLVEMLGSSDPKVRYGSLKILKEVVNSPKARVDLARLGGMQQLVRLLDDRTEEVRLAVAETIAKAVKLPYNRRVVRRTGGIVKLVDMLRVRGRGDRVDKILSQGNKTVQAGCVALWALSTSRRNRAAINKAGCTQLVAKLLDSSNQKLLMPTLGLILALAEDDAQRPAVIEAGIPRLVVAKLAGAKEKLQTVCAGVLWRLVHDSVTQEMVLKLGGIDSLVKMLSIDLPEAQGNAAGALAKCAEHPACVAELSSRGDRKTHV